MRAEELGKLIPRAQLRRSSLGSFAWPAGVDPETWTIFRVAEASSSRSLDEIAPEEIANAMKAVLADNPFGGADDVLRRTAELFGIVRLGPNVRSRLESVHRMLPGSPD